MILKLLASWPLKRITLLFVVVFLCVENVQRKQGQMWSLMEEVVGRQNIPMRKVGYDGEGGEGRKHMAPPGTPALRR